MRYAGVGNVTTAGLALALPVGWELWRAYARARIVSLCRAADRWDLDDGFGDSHRMRRRSALGRLPALPLCG